MSEAGAAGSPLPVVPPALPSTGGDTGSTGAFGDTVLEINEEDLSAAADAMDAHSDNLRAVAGEASAVVDVLVAQAGVHVSGGSAAPVLSDAVENGIRVALDTLSERLTVLATLLGSDAKAFRKIIEANSDKEKANAAKVASIDTGSK